jgi:hypothetical protein
LAEQFEGGSTVSFATRFHYAQPSTETLSAGHSLQLQRTPEQCYVLGVTADEWESAIIEAVKLAFPLLSARKQGDRARHIAFASLAYRTILYLINNAHVFGEGDVLIENLFPHLRPLDGSGPLAQPRTKRMAVHVDGEVPLDEGVRHHLLGACIIPLHLFFFFQWLLHRELEIPTAAILSEREYLERLCQEVVHEVGKQQQQTYKPGTPLQNLISPHLAALNIVPAKLDHLLILLTRWQQARRIRLQIENKSLVHDVARTVNQIVAILQRQQQATNGTALELAPIDISTLVSPQATRIRRAKRASSVGGGGNRKRKRQESGGDSQESSSLSLNSSSASLGHSSQTTTTATSSSSFAQSEESWGSYDGPVLPARFHPDEENALMEGPPPTKRTCRDRDSSALLHLFDPVE